MPARAAQFECCGAQSWKPDAQRPRGCSKSLSKVNRRSIRILSPVVPTKISCGSWGANCMGCHFYSFDRVPYALVALPRDGDSAVRATATFFCAAFADDLDKKDIGFRRSDPRKFPCAIEIRILRLGPFGANSELEFVGGGLSDLCELAAPLAGNARSRCRGNLFLGRDNGFCGGGGGGSLGRRRRSCRSRRRGKLRGCGRDRGRHGKN